MNATCRRSQHRTDWTSQSQVQSACRRWVTHDSLALLVRVRGQEHTSVSLRHQISRTAGFRAATEMHRTMEPRHCRMRRTKVSDHSEDTAHPSLESMVRCGVLYRKPDRHSAAPQEFATISSCFGFANGTHSGRHTQRQVHRPACHSFY